MKKFVDRLLSFLIIILIIFIGYLFWENYSVKKVEAENTKDALETYDTVTCSKNEITADDSNGQFTNSQAKADEIIGYIMFPSLGKSSAILQGDLSDDQAAAMDRGVSHDPQSSMPGEAGNSVFAGHRELFFKNFLNLNEGDDVVINIKNNIYIYEIQSFEVIEPDEVNKVFYENDKDLLVMYTCYPIESWKPFNKRMVLKAKPISKTTVEDCETVTKIK